MRRSTWRNVRAAAKGLLANSPMVIARDEIAEMARTLSRLTASVPFQVIHADQLSMAGYGQFAADNAARHGPRPATLLDEHNAIYLLTQRMADTESDALRRLIIRREAAAFARYEARMLAAYDAVLTVTEEDRLRLLALLNDAGRRDAASASKFTVLPICGDAEQVSVIPRAPGGPPTILHLGTMFWPPNIQGVLWFARQVLPLVHRRVPEARFVIAGKNPPPEVVALGADPRIEVAGYVPDPVPCLEASDVFIVPLHTGGGMRVKIVDAWLRGLPVVSTPIGAEGIESRDGENILIAATPEAFADATIRLLADPALNARLRADGRRWAEERYSWQTVYRRVDEVYARLLDRKSNRG
ncbi:MAG: D-inositol-3-phosphate glycosyltransferase [Chloroflexi bacterium ADurb.Bin325]|nr:MAG: D-inositol-3-phosphate glycosyltransferase [Chloroflexi bacterium ADurb.Bin325]